MVSSASIQIPKWTSKVVSLWKDDVQLRNPLTGEIVSNYLAYGVLLQDFAECYLKDNGMSDDAFERFKSDVGE